MNTLFDDQFSIFSECLRKFRYPWLALSELKNDICKLGNTLTDDYVEIKECVWAHRSANIAEGAELGKYTIIDAETQIRRGANLRGCVVVGRNCVVGNGSEIKNSVLFDGVQIPHLNYVGDSILGRKAHLGAGAIISNVKEDRSMVSVVWHGIRKNTGLQKCGAFLGDFTEIGCNCVLNPGTIVGRRTSIYPLSCVRGALPCDSIMKASDCIVAKEWD